MSLFHLYAAIEIVPAQVLRPVHVGWTLLLVFLLFPIAARYRNRLMWWDVVCAALGVATIVYLLAGGDDIWDRNTLPSKADMFFGVTFVLLVLEAVRRTSGWIMLFVIGLFLAYGFCGPWLPGQWAHRGYDVSSLSGFMYQTLEGIFGTAVDVSSSLIILFTIYGAFLQHSGAGKFYLDWSFAAMGSRHSGAGRTVVLASFLLGGPSGSGRRDDGDDRRGRLSDAEARGVRPGSGRRPARGRGSRRDHLAAGAGRRRLPHRGVPEDQLPRRAADGDRAHAALLPVAVPDGRARHPQVRPAGRGHRGRGAARAC